VPIRVHLNGIYRWNRNEEHGVGMAPLDSLQAGGFWPPAYPAVPAGDEVQVNDQLLLRAGLEFVTRPLDLFTEFSVDMLPRMSQLAFEELPLLLTQGALVKFRNGLGVKLAADVSLQQDDPAPEVARLPDWRLTLAVTWRVGLARGDRDQDGIGDAADACPGEAEDFDGFEDQDGCPDPDNDQDGIPDRRDLAPSLPEDPDGFEDDDGRPDMDNDGDGIPDAEDGCPDEPEDFDGDRDMDGCPDLQRDDGDDGSPRQLGCSSRSLASSQSASISCSDAASRLRPWRRKASSTYLKRPVNFATVDASAASGSTPRKRARLATEKSMSPSSSAMRRGSPPASASRSSPASSTILPCTCAAVSHSKPTAATSRCTVMARRSGGSDRGILSSRPGSASPRARASASFMSRQ
jgi:hypothetical protein